MDGSLMDLRSGQLSPPYDGDDVVCRGSLRPQLHFSAPRGFINDPNGLFFDETEGTWHLYYQYNPTDTVAGNQHWGHATSHDLYVWDHQPIALSPASDAEGIFSGSVVLDPDNTSGFFPDQKNGVLAYYTLNTADEETQHVAYSRDGGYTFTKHAAGNPVLAIGSHDFRDPKVFWYGDHWVMVVACAREHTVGIYTSPDGLEWSHASNFSHTGLLGSQWECPNLVQMPVEREDQPLWLMYISINPGAPQGGSIGQYFAGHFNGTHFTPVDSAARIADWAKDNYATQFFSGIPAGHKQVSIAWASNWQYTNKVPTGPTEGWASVMSLPRTNWLRKSPDGTGYTLVSLPYNLDGLRSQNAHGCVERELGRSTGLSRTRVDGLLARKSEGGDGSGAFLLDVKATGLDLRSAPGGSINFTIFSTLSGEKITGGVRFEGPSGDATVWVDRGGIRGWDNPFYTNRFSAAHFLPPPVVSFDFQIVVDRSILEIFSVDGDKSATLIYYPEQLLDAVDVELVDVNAEARVHVHLYPLRPTASGATNGPRIANCIAP
ncbi:hypothetical protein PV08_10911 [Exophiala spinifera]|uniref:Uncharacterized protein n=1 Tax=Exophiala spinifera TaxID=91928 RepID=A0A0D2BK12_9EURO|nr:uncharacterized protein PV08_10911 [Exophiala spinifera]KIW11609.1 hypothetical protein PV08_10911 [Exophiala spinifera]